jgi:cell division protein FtsI (penicillin-binding protein 3)
MVCLFFLVWACAIAARLFWLQIVRHQEFVERAQKQQQRTFEVAPRRGVLYDRNLRELAMTVQVDSIYAVPTEIDDKQAAAHALAAAVHTDPDDAQTTEQEIVTRLNKGNSFAWIARRVSPDVATKVKALPLKGIYFQKEFERFYPDNLIAAQVLGYVGIDDNGLGGLEQKFEPQLHGVPGRMFTAVDAHARRLGSTEHEPEPGQNLVLTIDENIQFLAEKALDHVMEKTQAANGTVVVQDVHTGQILALAIRPTFNPNDFRRTTPALLRNHAISDVYEPGSTFKLVTYSAALDQQAVKPDDMIDCLGGAMQLPGRVIHDDKADHFGVVTVHYALEHSSDVAAVKLVQKLGQDKFYEYIRNFGFGQRTGTELPGETRGLLQPVKRWGTTSYASIAIGQEIAVTPLQLVSMVSTIANGGVYLPPHVLMPAQVDAASQKPGGLQTPQASPFKPGGELPNPLPPGAHRVLTELTAAQMRKMMEGVVLFGTGKGAQLNGYSSGGKTGTRKRLIRPPISTPSPCTSRPLPASRPSTIRSSPSPSSSTTPRARPTTVQPSPRLCFRRSRSRCLSILASRTISMCAPRRPPARRKQLLRKTTQDRIPATSMRSTPQSTICPATIRCAPHPTPTHKQPRSSRL